jgi:hypothetical protein
MTKNTIPLVLVSWFISLSFYCFANQTPEIRKSPICHTDFSFLYDSSGNRNDSTRVYYFYSSFENAGKPTVHLADTALENFQIYDPLFKDHRFFSTLGNIGQNYRELIPFKSIHNPLGFDYGIHTFDRYLMSVDSVKYYKIFKTYSELTYVQGAKKEQNFWVTFSRDIYQGLNLGFDFRVANAPGAYSRQRTNHINLIVNGQYFTENKKYGVIAAFIYNRIRNYENGGLMYDSLFSENIEPNRLVIPVNLKAAENRVRESAFFMKHYIDLKRAQQVTTDSLNREKSPFDLGRLSYSFSFKRHIEHFSDVAADSSFFPPPLLDSLETHDSLTIRKFQNILTWSNPTHKSDNSPRVLQFIFGIRQEYHEVSLQEIKYTLNQYIPFGSMTFSPYHGLQLLVKGEYVTGDYNEQDFVLDASLNLVLGKRERNAGNIKVNALGRSEQPGWYYSRYHGNYYQWENSWNKTNYLLTSFAYMFKNIETGIALSRITNYVYLDSNSLPKQLPDEFAYMHLYLKTKMNWWRFRVFSHLVYHTVQKTNVLRLPAFMGNLALYYYQPLFNGAALLEPGLNFYYNTPYYADQYNPSLRSFYLQNTKETGNYLFMDVFVNLKIQRARFFFTYTHFNAGLMGYNYFSTPGYPAQDGAFKFGVSWRFHD